MTANPEPALAAAGVRALPRPPDFSRRLVCILGLPFDACTLPVAIERIRGDAFAGRRCFVSTPNLNFVIAARTDVEFRGSVMRSDLSLVDGMPLVWMARLLRLPLPMRVAGSDLFDALLAHHGPPLDIYLFGGPPGAAAAACARINARVGGVRCVGFETPGVGDVLSMSTREQIDRINGSGAHFVVVALGARKGQAWIEHNAERLQAPVLSHLGAVLNFAAGSLRRSPRWMQRCGLEWLWRVREEPVLWRRYFNDGVAAAGLLLTRLLPDAMVAGHRRQDSPASIEQIDSGATAADSTLALRGSWTSDGALSRLAAALADCADRRVGVVVDMSRATDAGNGLAALLLVARGWFERHGGFRLVGARGRVAASFRRKAIDFDA